MHEGEFADVGATVNAWLGGKSPGRGIPGQADHRAVKLDNPLVVQWEYASEERLAKRNKTYRELTEGVNPEDVVFEAVRESSPQRFLDVGCGMGELAERVQRELGAEVVAVDISPRMVELTRARGVDAQVADVQALPFEDGSFDCVAANWVLYHVPDLDLRRPRAGARPPTRRPPRRRHARRGQHAGAVGPARRRGDRRAHLRLRRTAKRRSRRTSRRSSGARPNGTVVFPTGRRCTSSWRRPRRALTSPTASPS